jgi:hypothetical protein
VGEYFSDFSRNSDSTFTGHARRSGSMTYRLLKYVIVLFAFAIPASADEIFFNNTYTLWKDADVLLWTPDSVSAVKPTEFVLSLKRNNTGIGNPTCRLAGDWQRDSIAFRYATWLRENVEPKVNATHLRARSPAMVKRLNESGDQIILFVTRKGETLYAVLFEGESAEPKAAGRLPYTEDTIAMGDALADMFFSGHTERRLTPEERKKAAMRPNAYYAEAAKFHGWVGIGAGHTQAKVPFTPDSWYSQKLRSRIKSYRNTKDSLSIWNFLEDESPLFSVYAGGTWYGFIGAELFLRYSQHDAKVDANDTVYNELDYWTYTRYEIGLNVHLSTTYHTIPSWILYLTPFWDSITVSIPKILMLKKVWKSHQKLTIHALNLRTFIRELYSG